MSTRPLACVIGDMDLIRPLGLAAIPCAVVSRPGHPHRRSRFVRAVADWVDSRAQGEKLVEALIRFGSSMGVRPILYYQADQEMLFISRHRSALMRAFHFLMPDAERMEELTDKGRFAELANRLELPVPATLRLNPEADVAPRDVGLPFPFILKPLTRRKETWDRIVGPGRKALEVQSPEALRDLWPALRGAEGDLLVQELIPGPETRIESYHVYRDPSGEIAGEFTGRKIRTYPVAYGHSTAVEISSAPDVADLGRELVRRLDLVGVAKLDFKRDPSGKLRLLEINPRFNLWHHPGAVAGVNLPALVYADLTGTARPAVRAARPGVCWCRPWRDRAAARASGVPVYRWLPWALRCEAISAIALDDPMPILQGLWLSMSDRFPLATRA